MNFFSIVHKYFVLSAFLLFLSCGQSTTTERQNLKTADSVGRVDEASSNNKIEKGGKIIMFFGNSLTAGYGIDPKDAFPALIQEKIDSLGLNYEVINAGLSGETTASGENRVEWILKQKVDVFVLELGANDGLRGINLKETKSNLQEIIDQVAETYPEAELILAGMQIPPNMGPEYASEFRKIFPELAEKNDIHLIQFLLQGVGGEPELNLADGIHPNEEGHKILAENVWEVLKNLM